jgi:hypothetical protein
LLLIRGRIFSTLGNEAVDPRRKNRQRDRAQVEKGPIPAYPRSVPWTTKQGTGRYELHVQKDGNVLRSKSLIAAGRLRDMP